MLSYYVKCCILYIIAELKRLQGYTLIKKGEKAC